MRQLPLISQGSLCLPESPSKGRQGKQAGETNIHVQVYGTMVPQDVQELIFRIRDFSIFT